MHLSSGEQNFISLAFALLLARNSEKEFVVLGALGSDPIKDTPFVVINADDYYGKEGFKKVHGICGD